jgi:hypothetical protein
MALTILQSMVLPYPMIVCGEEEEVLGLWERFEGV